MALRENISQIIGDIESTKPCLFDGLLYSFWQNRLSVGPSVFECYALRLEASGAKYDQILGLFIEKTTSIRAYGR